LWNEDKYYKKRSKHKEKGSKYLCPRGHFKPLFVPYKHSSQTLFIVEGELNALSLAQLEPEGTVCSPGGTSDFFGKNFDYYKKFYLKYKYLYVILDKDAAGIKAALESKAKFIEITPYVEFIFMDNGDCNDLLNFYGKNEFKKRMEMLMGMQANKSTLQTP
jgi:DNA primase